MQKPIELHEFNSTLYPYRLWISIGYDEKVLKEKFVEREKRRELNFSIIENYEAITYNVEERIIPGKRGQLVVFSHRKHCITRVMAHEAAHVAKFMWDAMGEEQIGDEANAYLVGWAADCMYKAYTKHGQTNNTSN